MVTPKLRLSKGASRTLAQAVQTAGQIADSPVIDSPDPIVLFDRDLRCVYANAALERVVRDGSATLVGQHLEDILGKLGDIGAFSRCTREVFDSGDARSVEIAPTIAHLSCNSSWRLAPVRELGEPVRFVLCTCNPTSERVTAENLLEESEARYQSLVDLSPAAVAVVVDERFVFVNQTAVEILGAGSASDIIGRPALSLVCDDDLPAMQPRMQAVLRGEFLSPVRVGAVRFDGRTIIAEVSSSPITYLGRLAAQVVVTDVTETVLTEAALRHEAEQMAAIIQTQADIAAAEGDPDELMQLIVDRTRSVTGAPAALIGLFEEDETVYRWVSCTAMDEKGVRLPIASSVGGLIARGADHVVIDDCSIDPRPEAAAFRANGRGSAAAAALTRDGRPIGVMLLHSPEPRAFGDPIVHTLRTMAGFVSAIMQGSDEQEARKQLLAERTAALDALRESEQRFRSLFEQSTIGIYRTTTSGKLILANPALATMLGYESAPALIEERLGETCDRLYSEGYSRDPFLEQVERDGFVRGLETAWKHKDGSTIHVRENAIAVRDASGVTLFYEGTVEDVTDWHLAVKAIRESEASLRLLAENSTDVITRQDMEGQYHYVSPSIQRLTGLEPADMVGHHPAEFIHPDDVERHAIEFQRLLEGVGGQCVNLRIRRTDGEYLWAECSRRVVYDERTGQAVEVQGASRDITERMAAVEALRRSEETFRALVENSTDIILLVNSEGIITYCGPQVKPLMGWEPAELEGRSCYEWLHPDEVAGLEEDFLRLLTQPGTARTNERRVMDRQGVWKRMEVTGHNLLGTSGINAVVVVVHDLSEALAAAAAIRENEARFRGAFDEAPIGMALVDTKGRFTRVNAVLCHITGYTEDQLLSMSAAGITHPDDQAADLEFVRQALAGEANSHHCEKRHRCADGSWRWVSVSSSAIRPEDGATPYFVAQIQDISEARAAADALKESEYRFRYLWNVSADGFRLMDENGIVLMVNEAFCQFVGKTAGELVGRPFSEIYAPEYRTMNDGVLQHRVKTGTVERHMERGLTLWDGRFVYVEVSNVVLENDGERPLVLSSFRDSTEKRKQQAALEHYKLLAEHANDIILFVRPDNSIMEANDAAARAYGFTRDELATMFVHDIRAPGAGGSPAKPGAEDLDSPVVFETMHRRKDGSEFPVEVSVQRTVIGKESIFLNVIRDTTERTALARELEHQAFHDSLTGLPNRALFLDRLGHALLGSSRHGGTVAVLFVDLDRFKMVNDSLGHQAGDQLLVSVAGRLRGCIRGCDTAARFGGDEFTVLLEGVSGAGDAVLTAERILRRLQAPFDLDGHEVFVSGSIGVAVSGGANVSADDLMREADAAMYQAKSTGMAKYALYERDMSTGGRERLQLETDLRRAIERNEFEVYYQPIVLLETSQTIGVEALARWRHPRFGLMPPDTFVPLQEQIGLIEPFTMWVLKRAQEDCLGWQKKGIHLGMSVNLSVHNLHEEGFERRVCEMLRETGLPPSLLKLEITESAVMMNPRRALDILSELAAAGIRLSIDDFGTGYSSLTYLKQMPVHEIKIDKSFVLGMDTHDDDDAAIVRATIDLAHNLRKKVVAEGVESQTVWDVLKMLGCDAAQGYFMARPMPASKLCRWLRTSRFGLGSGDR